MTYSKQDIASKSSRVWFTSASFIIAHFIFTASSLISYSQHQCPIPPQPSTASWQSGPSGQSAISPVGRVTPSGHVWWRWSLSLEETRVPKPSRGRNVSLGSATADKPTVTRRNDARSSVKRGGAHRAEPRSPPSIQVGFNWELKPHRAEIRHTLYFDSVFPPFIFLISIFRV